MSKLNVTKVLSDISEMLPDSPDLNAADKIARDKIARELAEEGRREEVAKEVAKAQASLKAERENDAAKAALLKFREAKQKAKAEALAELEKEETGITAVEAIEIGNAEARKAGAPTINMASDIAKQIMASQGTTRPEVVKLLTALNVNLNLQLTKNDTANLLACLLTANETQLRALYSNRKVPIAVKTVIKRLLDDVKIGNIETVEKLWDRIFGKAGMMLNLPEQTQQQTGIIPNTPVSREAYIVIREALMK